MGDRQGIKGLSKDKRRKLEAYQHFFYLLQVRLTLPGNTRMVQPANMSFLFTCPHPGCSFFFYDADDPCHALDGFSLLFLTLLAQTNPSYLAKLIFQMPQNKSTKFMDTVIFTLYNYASNQREEYLLLKLFKTALEEEIKWVSPWVGVG